ncbi:hypothetical protein ACTMTI_25685 [Nonomuraea sp. H19]|uniref:hypothetical protein n=1 Tax=Nonomuraea sp. H19 TaxID=3452206 RepID=UPI003F891492
MNRGVGAQGGGGRPHTGGIADEEDPAVAESVGGDHVAGSAQHTIEVTGTPRSVRGRRPGSPGDPV